MAAVPGVESVPTAADNAPTISDLINNGRLGDAAALLEQRMSRTFGVLASLRHRLGDLRAAIAAYRASLELDEAAATHTSLAFLLCEAGSFEDASRHARRAMEMDGSSLPGFLAAATVEQCRRRYPHALELLDSAEHAHPNDVLILIRRVALLRQADRLEEAAVACGRALDLHPEHGGIWRERGLLDMALDRDHDAMAAFKQAEAVSPHPGRIVADQTVLRIQNGEGENEGFARAMAVADRSDLVSIMYDRAITTRLAPGDPAIDAMEKRLGETQQWMEKIQLHYALAHIHLGDARVEEAFNHLHAASPMVRTGFDYSVHDDEQRMLALAEAFSHENAEALRSAEATLGAASEAPIFVVGMPRSGTSLVEQILASHPEIHGIGEPALVDRLFRVPDQAGAPGLAERVNAWSRQDVRALGRSYLLAARRRAGNERRTVDKRTDNFRHLGLINLMLPEARIISCRRDPMDTGLSCYSRLFTTGHEYSYDLSEIGLYYEAYRRLMAHWRGLLPASRLLEVDYEALVAEPDATIRRMLDFCGLPWNENCLRFFETKRPVRSSSLIQVRAPIHARSVGRWKSCGSLLQPLRDVLADPDLTASRIEARSRG